ncbi:hypothetical protein F5882DRAFT_484591 [Hyaloscypha sp. PMI_1271]|nr:hypothetical protein F5882DRAFT_484591 [Hyaloscypha sp. PMI_1271]
MPLDLSASASASALPHLHYSTDRFSLPRVPVTTSAAFLSAVLMQPLLLWADGVHSQSPKAASAIGMAPGVQQSSSPGTCPAPRQLHHSATLPVALLEARCTDTVTIGPKGDIGIGIVPANGLAAETRGLPGCQAAMPCFYALEQCLSWKVDAIMKQR